MTPDLQRELERLEVVGPGFRKAVALLRQEIEQHPRLDWERWLDDHRAYRCGGLVCRLRGHTESYSYVTFRILTSGVDSDGHTTIMYSRLSPCQRCSALIRSVWVGIPLGGHYSRRDRVILTILNNQPSFSLVPPQPSHPYRGAGCSVAGVRGTPHHPPRMTTDTPLVGAGTPSTSRACQQCLQVPHKLTGCLGPRS